MTPRPLPPRLLPVTLPAVFAALVLLLLPHGLLGKPASEASAEEARAGGAALLQRVKRGWVWNQFFVLEEYTGSEPLYIGKVRVVP